MKTQVPSTHPPNYEVDPSVHLVPINGLARYVQCAQSNTFHILVACANQWTCQVIQNHNFKLTPIPINGLARVERPWQRYTIIGAGKTGLDALLYLLAQVWNVAFFVFVFVFVIGADKIGLDVLLYLLAQVWNVFVFFCLCICLCHCTQGFQFKSRCNVYQCINVQGVAPSKIQWVCSNDVWYLNRAAIVNDGGMHVRKLPQQKIDKNLRI